MRRDRLDKDSEKFLLRLYAKQLEEYSKFLEYDYSLRELQYGLGAIHFITLIIELMESSQGTQYLLDEYSEISNVIEQKIKEKEKLLQPIERIKIIKKKIS